MKKHTLKLDPILPLEYQGDYFPSHVFNDEEIEIDELHYLYYKFILKIFVLLLRLRLKILGPSYRDYKSDPSHREVEEIYTREAEDYEYKHHLTTNFRDTWWRRQIGLEVANYIRAKSIGSKEIISILDIGTGTGLSLEEMFRVFKLFDMRVRASGLDFNQKMLRQAEKKTVARMTREGLLADGIREIVFVRGDARNLTGGNGRSREGLEYFHRDSFDCTTIMFGIGGIDAQLESMREQLAVLKPNGILTMIDIHRPIIHLREEWPWFIGQKCADAFAVMAWEQVTKPLVLATLWGWRDPTRIFYTASLVVDSDEGQGAYYGFESISLSLNNEFWWFGLPTMSTAKITLKKIKISKFEFDRRQEILKQLMLLS